MNDLDQKKQADFMIEKIKERPVNKRRLLKKMLTTASMAVIFGLIACLTFLILEPVFSNWLTPEEEPQIVIFPEETEELAPEDMLANEQEPSLQEVVESVILEDEQIQRILDSISLDKEHYVELYNAMNVYKLELNRSMVTVTASDSEENFMNDMYRTYNDTYGVIIAFNGQDYLILTDARAIYGAEQLLVTLFDGTVVEASMKKSDLQTGMAVISVPIDDFSDATKKSVKIAALGTSNLNELVGIPVVALGCPMGMVGSAGYGMIVYKSSDIKKVDANYQLMITDVNGSSQASGILFDLHNHIIGVITGETYNDELKNNISAIGVSELRKLIQNMSNGFDTAYLGVIGESITTKINQEMGVPYGIYIDDVEIDSPAMLGGLQKGDVIINLAGESIANYTDYMTVLQKMAPGESIRVIIKRPIQDTYRTIHMEITLQASKEYGM